MKKPVATETAPGAVGPYSQAVVSGQFVFVSGQLPVDPATGRMPATAAEQAGQSLANIGAVLKAAGSSLDKAVRVGVFMTDLAGFQEVNEVYATFFSRPYPARTTVEVPKLPKGALVEIDCIAEL
ncbi:MAG: Rid family detoxifying hydrolase [Deltaproteobacteria bacterium]|jgi:2-iminobutanoate/2-iminopropanoate deaminase|nr:Rid family detoxifying hydrolase [Deltaproteobacteria bacterium]